MNGDMGKRFTTVHGNPDMQGKDDAGSAAAASKAFRADTRIFLLTLHFQKNSCERSDSPR